MATKEARQRATARYELKKYDKTLVRLSKGRKAELQAHAEARGESLNAFINRAIEEALGRDKNTGAS